MVCHFIYFTRFSAIYTFSVQLQLLPSLHNNVDILILFIFNTFLKGHDLNL